MRIRKAAGVKTPLLLHENDEVLASIWELLIVDRQMFQDELQHAPLVQKCRIREHRQSSMSLMFVAGVTVKGKLISDCIVRSSAAAQ